ncbi:hypothetical protein KC19_VG330800 [Ceratodon purpureus]|uniref:Uncharacterized protein n=1 Tax=Ceratodon purpureus TaxID=3225 RepID=A0A8T0HWL8_CERPU|nr:hypothetical protein KC19_VG330800 [Ceratodon purpureus]
MDIPHAASTSPSWASGDTIPVTPNTLLQNFSNRMPVGIAVSTEVSASIGTASQEMSPRPSMEYSRPTQSHCQPCTGSPSSVTRHTNNNTEVCDVPDGVTTRRMATVAGTENTTPRQPREKFAIGLLPHICSGAVAVNNPCFILHPDKKDTVVAEGRAGGSWKAPSTKFGHLCTEGQQMVQIHKIIVPNLPLPFIEERQPFTILEHAFVKPSGSNVYVKWSSRLLVKKPKVRPSVNRDPIPRMNPLPVQCSQQKR